MQKLYKKVMILILNKLKCYIEADINLSNPKNISTINDGVAG